MNPDAQRFIDLLEAGKIDLDDPGLVEAAAQDPELGLIVDELREVQALLGGGHEAEAVESALAAPSRTGDRQSVERAIHPLRPLGVRTHVLAAAAAVLLIAGGAAAWHSRAGKSAYDPGPRLGGPGQLELLEPIGEVDGFGTFAWRAPEVAGYWCIVTVTDLDTGAKLVSETLDSNIWRTEELQGAQRIEWSVECFRGSSTESSQSSPSRASRRR